MIIFDLACEQGHAFEGWFNSPADYDSQLQKGLLACAQCGSTAIRRVPSAPHLAKPARPHPVASRSAAPPTPTDIGQAYQQLMAAIAASCEDVGDQFAEEARKIHYLEAPERAILGQASAEDYEELRDEGIDVVRLPVFKKH